MPLWPYMLRRSFSILRKLESDPSTCNCDSTGSATGVCDAITGQCPCHSNVAREGETDITNQIAEKLCSSCKVNHYGFSSGAGCSACDCSTTGSTGRQCDTTGQCPCKETITGPTCGECQPTYYDFTITGCRPCNCSSDGVTSLDCDKATGVCPCKSYTSGDKCNLCKPGYFNLVPTNPTGCQKCFCYGHGADCSSSPGFVENIINVDNAQSWLIATSFNPNYVSAPPEFLGNMVYSYGQPFSLEIIAESGSVDLSQYNTLVLAGNGQMLYGRLYATVDTVSYSPFSVILHEDYWLVNDTTNATPEQVQAVLADLQGIYVRTFYDPISIAVRNIALTSAAAALEGDTRPSVTFVEQCTCHPLQNVQGLSCERCTEGNRRPTSTSSPYDNCVPCNCNGKQDGALMMCDENSGICLNCRNGTVGDHCENCAPNVVVAPPCDQCEDNFWGLSAVGCVACGCSLVGASSPVCEKSTGKCACKDKVTGRQCDVCEDNYYNLGATGCQICDGCYALVGDEVNNLRGMRDNLTVFVAQLKNNDNTSVIGDFAQRLTQTQVTLKGLLQFLTNVQSLETSQSASLSGLNSTLSSLLANLEQDDPTLIAKIQSELTNTANRLKISQNALSVVKDTMFTTLSNLEGLVAKTTTIKELVTALVTAEQQFTTMASATTNELARLDNEVVDIETVVTDTRNISSSSLQTARDITNLQTSISDRVAILSTSVDSLVALMAALNNTLVATLTSVTLEGQSVSGLEVSVDSLGQKVPSENDVIALQTQAGQVEQSAQVLNTKAQANSQSTILTTDIQTALSQSAALLLTVRNVHSQSDALLEEVKAASVIADSAKTSAATVFTNAEDMLTTLQNFQTIIAELQQQYQTAQQSVENVRTLSQNTITASQKLREDLRITFNSADLAVKLITTAHDLQRTKRDSLVPVSQQAQALKSEANLVLNDINSQAARIITANTTYVQPAIAKCQDVKPLVATVTNTSSEAYSKAQETSQAVVLTRDKALSLLQSLQNIPDINAAEITQLRNRVEDLDLYFSSQDFATLITQLRDKVQAQQAWIDAAIARKELLRQEVQSLRLTQGRLVHQTN